MTPREDHGPAGETVDQESPHVSPQRRMLTFAREVWFPNLGGLDSIQGLLELAEWYPVAHISIVVGQEQFDDPYSPWGRLRELETEGLIRTRWAVRNSSDHTLDKVWLTVAGHEKLKALREASKEGRWRARVSRHGGAAVTPMLTTLATLWVKSC